MTLTTSRTQPSGTSTAANRATPSSDATPVQPQPAPAPETAASGGWAPTQTSNSTPRQQTPAQQGQPGQATPGAQQGGGKGFKLPEGIPAPSLPAAAGPLHKKVRIADVLQTYGWPLDGWQAKFLMAADRAEKGSRKQGTQGDGELTVAELRDYAYHPDGAQFLTSLAVEQVAKEAGAGRTPGTFNEPWMNAVSESAAKAVGTKEGKVTAETIRAYGAKMASGTVEGGATWVTNQRVQVLYHSLARLTGERDAMDSPTKLKGTEMIFPAMTLAYDRENNVAITASNTYFAADARYAAETERTDKFYTSVADGVKPSVFEGPSSNNGRSWFDFKGDLGRTRDTYDKGHLLANLNFNAPQDRAISFATQNMHAQVPASNSGVWLHKVEMATREAVEKCNGRAVDVTGVLFADKDFKPLAADKIPWIAGAKGTGAKGDFAANERVPVPTHSWKAVLLQTGDNPPKFQAKVYIVENRIDLDRSSEPKVVSLKEMEKILGGNIKLFQDLPKDIRAKIENDPNAVFQPAKEVNFIADYRELNTTQFT